MNKMKVEYLNPKREVGERVYALRERKVAEKKCELCGHVEPVFGTQVVYGFVIWSSELRACVSDKVYVKMAYKVRLVSNNPNGSDDLDDDGYTLFSTKAEAQARIEALGKIEFKGEKA